jgi:hypothetical protein
VTFVDSNVFVIDLRYPTDVNAFVSWNAKHFAGKSAFLRSPRGSG